MITKNSVFIATSIDGYIADQNGGIEWLTSIPNPEGNDMGYGAFMSEIDAIVMGRKTFETVCAFDIDWPYNIPVYVLSNTLQKMPEPYKRKAILMHGTLNEILKQIHQKGHYRLYIDGGNTIQNFLKNDLIDELIISVIPVLLGKGIPLFSNLSMPLEFECKGSKVYLEMIIQSRYTRIRKK